MDSAALTMSQRCAWLYLRAQRDFVRALAMVSEALYTPGSSGSAGMRPTPSEAKERLRELLEELRPPPMAYVPLCHSSGRLAPVCRVLSTEGSVFLTRERASALVCCEVTSDEHSRKLSQLFEAVQSRGKLAAELGEIVGRPEDTLALRHIKHRSTPTSSSSAASAAAPEGRDAFDRSHRDLTPAHSLSAAIAVPARPSLAPASPPPPTGRQCTRRGQPRPSRSPRWRRRARVHIGRWQRVVCRCRRVERRCSIASLATRGRLRHGAFARTRRTAGSAAGRC